MDRFATLFPSLIIVPFCSLRVSVELCVSEAASLKHLTQIACLGFIFIYLIHSCLKELQVFQIHLLVCHFLLTFLTICAFDLQNLYFLFFLFSKRQTQKYTPSWAGCTVGGMESEKCLPIPFTNAWDRKA